MQSQKKIYPPGDFGIWLVIYIELFTFAGLFIGYAFSRRKDIELFNSSQELLQQGFGFINTILLISSSYFVVKAVNSIKKEHHIKKHKKASKFLLIASILACVFLIIKLIEFYNKYEQGITISTNSFFMFYYILTGFHFLHVVLGVIILLILAKKTKNKAYSSENCIALESGASYWHMVDLVWIILFPLIYILR